MIDNLLKPVASANDISAPRGKGTSFIGGYAVGSIIVRREELDEAMRVGICAMRRGGSMSARHMKTMRIGACVGGSSVVLVKVMDSRYARAWASNLFVT